jgi:hypothetical protein
MHASVSKTLHGEKFHIHKSAIGAGWVLTYGFPFMVILDDDELDNLKYAVDSAIFERDMGLDGAS